MPPRKHLHVESLSKSHVIGNFHKNGVERGYLVGVTGLRDNYGIYVAVTGCNVATFQWVQRMTP